MDIYAFLDDHGIGYQRHDHPAVFTCEQAKRLVPPLDAADAKNLFVRDRKGRRHFLVVVGYDKSVDLKALAGMLGVRALTLASPRRLRQHLGVDPGSVSLLSVVNDVEGAVQVVVDRALWRAAALGVHPLVNTSTLVMRRGDLERLLEVTGHSLQVLEIPGRPG